MTELRHYKTHYGCGGRLIYTANELGYTGYLCLSCGWWHPKNKNVKGGSPMPFPEGAKEAEDIAEARAIQLSKWEGGSLNLIEYKITETYTLGNKATLICSTVDGEPVTLFTFSAVVIEQLEAISGSLPNVIITPKDMGAYQTIY